MFETELLDELLDVDVNECSVCNALSLPRECKSCGMDTCAICVSCEYCD